MTKFKHIKKNLTVLFILLVSIAKAQQYCPGIIVLDTISIDTVPIHKSWFYATESCWRELSEFTPNYASYPSGLDVAVLITQINGPLGSIVDHNTLVPINQGDTLFMRKNNTNYDISLRHLDFAGFSFLILLIGEPTVYNEVHTCNYFQGVLYYTADCISWGYTVEGTSTCYTCAQVSVEEIPNTSEIKLYPNPTNQYTTLQTDNIFKNATLTVYNSVGQQVRQIKNINGQTITLHLDNITNGLYFIRLTEENKVIATDKLVITD